MHLNQSYIREIKVGRKCYSPRELQITYGKKFPKLDFQGIVSKRISKIRLIVETFGNNLAQKWKLALWCSATAIPVKQSTPRILVVNVVAPLQKTITNT
jgi:hypothetical protein